MSQEQAGRWVECTFNEYLDAKLAVVREHSGEEKAIFLRFIPAPDARDAEIARLKKAHELNVGIIECLDNEIRDRNAEIATLKSKLAAATKPVDVPGRPQLLDRAWAEDSRATVGSVHDRLESERLYALALERKVRDLEADLLAATDPDFQIKDAIDHAATLARIARRAEMIFAAECNTRESLPTEPQDDEMLAACAADVQQMWKWAYMEAMSGEPAHAEAERKVREGMVKP